MSSASCNTVEFSFGIKAPDFANAFGFGSEDPDGRSLHILVSGGQDHDIRFDLRPIVKDKGILGKIACPWLVSICSWIRTAWLTNFMPLFDLDLLLGDEFGCANVDV